MLRDNFQGRQTKKTNGRPHHSNYPLPQAGACVFVQRSLGIDPPVQFPLFDEHTTVLPADDIFWNLATGNHRPHAAFTATQIFRSDRSALCSHEIIVGCTVKSLKDSFGIALVSSVTRTTQIDVSLPYGEIV
jgi:hypothetical protein